MKGKRRLRVKCTHRRLCVSVIPVQTVVQASHSYQSKRWSSRLTHIGFDWIGLAHLYKASGMPHPPIIRSTTCLVTKSSFIRKYQLQNWDGVQMHVSIVMPRTSKAFSFSSFPFLSDTLIHNDPYFVTLQLLRFWNYMIYMLSIRNSHPKVTEILVARKTDTACWIFTQISYHWTCCIISSAVPIAPSDINQLIFLF